MSNLTLIIGNKNYSSWSLRPWLAMKQFGLEFEEIRIPLYQENSLAKIKQYSPSGKVPILQHDSITIWDSLAICQYLAEEFPAFNWWGKTRQIKAIARSISAEMHSGFMNLRYSMPMNCRQHFSSKEITPEVQKDIDRINNIWQEYRSSFGNEGDFLLGDFTIADAFFAPVVLRFVTYGVPLSPISQHYAETILANEPMQQWLNDAKSEAEIIPEFELS